jgi:hypothetical protein
VKFVPAQLFLEYTLVWKLINGLIVFAFARQQYLLAFEKSKKKISSNVIKFFLFYLLFSSVNIIASSDTLGLVARACILSVMINYVSLYVRGLTRLNPLVTSSLVSLAMYAVLSTIFYISTVNFSVSEISLKLYLQYLGSCVLIPVVCVQFFRPFLSKDII